MLFLHKAAYRCAVSTVPASPKSTPSASPLGVIGLFIGLSEATAGAAAIGTDGASRLILATFAVVFPLLVFGIFIWLLLIHPGNLYPPDQYTAHTSIQSYVNALRRERRASQAALEKAIVKGVSAVAQEQGGPGGQAVEESVQRAVAEVVSRESVRVERSGLITGAEPVSIAVDEQTTVQDLLDAVYFSLDDAVGPYEYGKTWRLLDPAGAELRKADSGRARYRQERRDTRPLSEVGIEGGTTLTVAPPVTKA